MRRKFSCVFLQRSTLTLLGSFGVQRGGVSVREQKNLVCKLNYMEKQVFFFELI